MRNFTQFIRGEEETRLDVHCFDLKGKEGEELYGILKNLGFTFCYVESDSLLAFLTGKYSYVKNIMKKLEEHYEFSWPEDPAIIGVSDKEINRDFLKKFKRREKKIKTVSKKKFRAYVEVQKSGITNMYDIKNVIYAADGICDVKLTRGDCIYIMKNYKKLMEAFKMKWIKKWKVKSESGNGSYVVSLSDKNEWGCSCPVWKFRRQECKHIKGVKLNPERFEEIEE